MKLKKTRSCKYCRCYQPGFIGDKSSGRCELGFDTEIAESTVWHNYTEYEDATINIKPSEPCYKPRTIYEAIEARELTEQMRKDKFHSL